MVFFVFHHQVVGDNDKQSDHSFRLLLLVFDGSKEDEEGGN